MNWCRLSHILPWVLISSSLALLSTAQDHRVAAPLVPASYQKWLEDVSYIITDEERTDFTKLSSDQQRDRFIDDFWKGRNPNPGSPKNIFKEEHYRRLAYVNEHFAAGVPGYKTDRGRIYIRFGPADRIEQHFSAAGSYNVSDLVGVGPVPYDWELWHYQYIEGIGEDVTFRLVNTCGCGRYQIPITKADLNKYKSR